MPRAGERQRGLQFQMRSSDGFSDAKPGGQWEAVRQVLGDGPAMEGAAWECEEGKV